MEKYLFKIEVEKENVREIFAFDSREPKLEIFKDGISIIGKRQALHDHIYTIGGESGLSFKDAFEALKEGKKIALPEWKGYWAKSPYGNTILMYCKDGRICNINGQMDDTFATMDNICREDWRIVK